MNTRRADTTATPRLGRYRIDSRRSTVTFRGRHLFGLMPVRGSFTVGTGTIDVAEPLRDSTIRVEIPIGSFHTGNEHRDRDVRSARFLDAGQHPVMTFTADHIDSTAVTGTLTVRGVSRSVTLSIERAARSADGFAVAATTRIDRTEFGITAARGLAGRHLDVSLEITCVRT